MNKNETENKWDETRWDKTRQDKTRQQETKQQDETRQDEAARWYTTRHDTTRQGETQQERQDSKMRQDKTEWDKTRQDKRRQQHSTDSHCWPGTRTWAGWRRWWPWGAARTLPHPCTSASGSLLPSAQTSPLACRSRSDAGMTAALSTGCRWPQSCWTGCTHSITAVSNSPHGWLLYCATLSWNKNSMC